MACATKLAQNCKPFNSAIRTTPSPNILSVNVSFIGNDIFVNLVNI
jgi:hypothetical protein